MKRIAVLVILAIIVSGAFILGGGRNADVTIINARAIPLNNDNTRFMVTFELQNEGSAKTLTGLHSASAPMVHFMNPGYDDTPIVIPANSNGIFAMDGAHVMVMGAEGSVAEGASLPLTLEFADAPKVTARALNVGNATGMNHDMSNGVQSEQSPKITLNAANGLGANATEISVDVENFTFVRVEDGAPHVPNHGHAHIYLNGLKLGRLYDTKFSLGPVPSGTYELVVSLNSNTHQPYINGDVLIQDSLSFTVAE